MSSAHLLTPLELRLAPLDEAAHSLLRILGLHVLFLSESLSVESSGPIDIVRAVDELLRQRDRSRGPGRQTLGPLTQHVIEILSRNDAVHQAELEGVLR